MDLFTITHLCDEEWIANYSDVLTCFFGAISSLLWQIRYLHSHLLWFSIEPRE